MSRPPETTPKLKKIVVHGIISCGAFFYVYVGGYGIAWAFDLPMHIAAILPILAPASGYWGYYAYDALVSRVSNRTTELQTKIIRPEGNWAFTILQAIVPKKTFEEVFVQCFADMREECNELAELGLERRRRWISFVHHCSIFFALALLVVTKIVKRAVSLWKLS